MSPDSAPTKVQEALKRSLMDPAEEFLTRPGKGFRAQLVELGCLLLLDKDSLSPEQKRRCQVAARVIEKIHAGSLIVDDIQDGSLVRRNRPTLHLKYGVAKALNAGNWLYFSPLTSLKEMGLAPSEELQLHRDCLETLSNAHCGQALDIGVRIDEVAQEDVALLCRSSLEWKTGELIGLALRLGAYAAQGDMQERARIHELGRSLGVGLQMLDDAGNFTLSLQDPMAQKRHEDLYLRRPSWLWAHAAESLSGQAYGAWIQAVRALPDEAPLSAWLEGKSFVSSLREEAKAHLRGTMQQFKVAFPRRKAAHEVLRKFHQTLEKSYG